MRLTRPPGAVSVRPDWKSRQFLMVVGIVVAAAGGGAKNCWRTTSAVIVSAHAHRMPVMMLPTNSFVTVPPDEWRGSVGMQRATNASSFHRRSGAPRFVLAISRGALYRQSAAASEAH